MEITCDKCGNKAKIPDDKLPEKPVKVRCKKCGEEFVVAKPKPESVHEASVEKLADDKIKIECPNCKTAHIVNSTKLPEGKIKVKCKKCSEPFIFESPKRKKPPPPPKSELPKEFFEATENSFEKDLKITSDDDFVEPVSTDAPLAETASQTLIPNGLNVGTVKKKTRDGYYTIDEDGNEYGPLDLIALRNWVRAGQINDETIILTPDGDNTVASRMPELALAFERKEIPEENSPEVSKPHDFSWKDFLTFILSGSGVGLVFGLGMAILAAVFGPRFLPFATISLADYTWGSALIIIVISLCMGLLISLLAAMIEAFSKEGGARGKSHIDELQGAIGAVIGGIIGLVALLSNNTGMIGAIALVLYLYLMAIISNSTRKKLLPSS